MSVRDDEPLHVSEPTARSLWQRYRIHRDRLVLETHLGTLDVPFAKIEEIHLHDSDVERLMRGELNVGDLRPALKVDWANFQPHVKVDREGTLIRRILLTPADPPRFFEVLREALDAWRQGNGEAAESGAGGP